MIRSVLALLLAGLLCAGCSDSHGNGGAGGPGNPYGPPISDMPYDAHVSPRGQDWVHPRIFDTSAQVAVISSEIDNTVPQMSPTGLTWAEEGGPALGLRVWIVHHEWWSPQLPNGGRGYSVRGEHSRSGRWIAVVLGPQIGTAYVNGDPRLEALSHELAHELRYIPDDGRVGAGATARNLCAEAGCPGRSAERTVFDPAAVFVGSR